MKLSPHPSPGPSPVPSRTPSPEPQGSHNTEQLIDLETENALHYLRNALIDIMELDLHDGMREEVSPLLQMTTDAYGNNWKMTLFRSAGRTDTQSALKYFAFLIIGNERYADIELEFVNSPSARALLRAQGVMLEELYQYC